MSGMPDVVATPPGDAFPPFGGPNTSFDAPVRHLSPGHGSAGVDDHGVALDAAFTLVCTALVLLMQPGFMLLETKATILKNCLDFAISTCMWCAVGHGLAYGGVSGVAGLDTFGVTARSISEVSDAAQFMFQASFAATAATITSGAITERVWLGAYAALTCWTSAITYPMAAHWLWSESGWLRGLGASDFAGAVVVHVLGGCIALVLCIHCGARLGRFDNKTGAVRDITGASPLWSTLGVWLIAIGFIGFNAGSVGSISHTGTTASRVVLCSLLSGASAQLTESCFTRATLGGWSISSQLNSLLAGMVAATATSATSLVSTVAAAGCIAGFTCHVLETVLLHGAKIDDPVHAAAVHIGGGVVGHVAFALDRWARGGSTGEMLANLFALVVIIVWSVASTQLVVTVAAKLRFQIVIPQKEQVYGCDAHLVGPAASQDDGGAVSIAGLLADPDGRNIFRSFLHRRACEEMLNFVDAVDTLGELEEFSETDAEFVLQNFVVDGAPSQINIADWTRQEVERQAAAPSPSMFDTAVEEVRHLLNNQFTDFSRTQEFRQWKDEKSATTLHDKIMKRIIKATCCCMRGLKRRRRPRRNRSTSISSMFSPVSTTIELDVAVCGLPDSGKDSLLLQALLRFSPRSISAAQRSAALQLIREEALGTFCEFAQTIPAASLSSDEQLHHTALRQVLDSGTSRLTKELARSISNLRSSPRVKPYLEAYKQAHVDQWSRRDYIWANCGRFCSAQWTPTTHDYIHAAHVGDNRVPSANVGLTLQKAARAYAPESHLAKMDDLPDCLRLQYRYSQLGSDSFESSSSSPQPPRAVVFLADMTRLCPVKSRRPSVGGKPVDGSRLSGAKVLDHFVQLLKTVSNRDPVPTIVVLTKVDVFANTFENRDVNFAAGMSGLTPEDVIAAAKREFLQAMPYGWSALVVPADLTDVEASVKLLHAVHRQTLRNATGDVEARALRFFARNPETAPASIRKLESRRRSHSSSTLLPASTKSPVSTSKAQLRPIETRQPKRRSSVDITSFTVGHSGARIGTKTTAAFRRPSDSNSDDAKAHESKHDHVVAVEEASAGAHLAVVRSSTSTSTAMPGMVAPADIV